MVRQLVLRVGAKDAEHEPLRKSNADSDGSASLLSRATWTSIEGLPESALVFASRWFAVLHRAT